MLRFRKQIDGAVGRRTVLHRVSFDPRKPRIPRIQDPRFSSLVRKIRCFRDPRFDRENQILLRGIRGLFDVFEKGSAVQFHPRKDPRFGGPD